MERAKVLKTLIEETGMTMKGFAENVGIPYTTLYSILERGVGKASIDNVLKICKALGITTEELDMMAFDGESYKPVVKREEIIQLEALMNDPQTGAFFKDFIGASEEKKAEMIRFWNFIQEAEKGRKPGDRQGE